MYLVLTMVTLGYPSVIVRDIRDVVSIEQVDAETTVSGQPFWSNAAATVGLVLGVAVSPWFFASAVLYLHRTPTKAKAPGYILTLNDGTTFSVTRTTPWGYKENRHTAT